MPHQIRDGDIDLCPPNGPISPLCEAKKPFCGAADDP